jgi:hypothetical protein
MACNFLKQISYSGGSMRKFMTAVAFLILGWQASAAPSIETSIGDASFTGTQYLNYSFGTVQIGDSRYIDLRTTNVGSNVLTFDTITYSGPGYFVTTNCPASLQPQESCIVSTQFRPLFNGYATGKLYLGFSNGDAVNVSFTGWGDRY